MEIKNFIDKWGGVNLRNIEVEREREVVYKEDVNLLLNYSYISNLHKCVDIYEEYLVVEFYQIKIRIKPIVFHPLDEIPKFNPFEEVKYFNSKGVLEYGIIKGIHWHNNDRKFYYDIEVNGKMKTRRYYDVDLEKV